MGLRKAIIIFEIFMFCVACLLFDIQTAISIMGLSAVLLVASLFLLSVAGVDHALHQPEEYLDLIRNYHKVEASVSPDNPAPFYQYNLDGTKVDFYDERDEYLGIIEAEELPLDNPQLLEYY